MSRAAQIGNGEGVIAEVDDRAFGKPGEDSGQGAAGTVRKQVELLTDGDRAVFTPGG